MYITTFDGVQFVEGKHARAQVLGNVEVRIGGLFSSAQLRSLDDVKRLLAKEVVALGGNALIDFRYGQKSVGFWRSIIHRDDINWYGQGQAAILL